MSMSLAPSSRKTYLKTIQEFMEFKQNYSLPNITPTPYEHIAKFCVYSKRRGLAPQTIRSKLAAIAYWLKAQGFPDHTNDFRLHKLLSGWAREHGRQPDDREPLTPNILKGLRQTWAQVCSSSYEQLLLHAAALIAFFAALRISELVPAGKTDRSNKALLFSDVKLIDEGLQISIRSSKTDQRAKGAVVVLTYCNDEEICPVRAVTTFMANRGAACGYFFIHKSGFPLTKYQFWTLTNKALKLLGLQQHKFGTHSFRIGAASTAARLGYGAEKIKSLGRWKSDAYKGYVRPVSV
ncbi:integrase/recombinase xerD homolog [Anolis sagrei]|uniref:integrase/recombinase xerD homolog n=1 Tax=Anolis sagrei TaxID=38937 RepID=UPI003522D884